MGFANSCNIAKIYKNFLRHVRIECGTIGKSVYPILANLSFLSSCSIGAGEKKEGREEEDDEEEERHYFWHEL